MFNLTENRYLERGLVKYENETGDRLMIIAEKDGSAFKAKVRPASGIDVDVIKLKFPYVEQGINFRCSSGQNFKLLTNDREMFTEAVGKIQDWVEMMQCMKTLVCCNLNAVFIKNGENGIISYCNSLLEKLNQYPEMQPFVRFFCCAANN